MKNLENYGVQEMNTKEKKGLNGGALWVGVNGTVSHFFSFMMGMSIGNQMAGDCGHATCGMWEE